MEKQKPIITEHKKEMLAKMPNIETQISKSKDGKWVIVKTVITDIKSIKYYEKVLQQEQKQNNL